MPINVKWSGDMFYKKVETEEELNIFDSIWIPAWQEKGFELECLLGKVDRYLIKNDEGEYIGTVSFRPYHFDSTIDDVFPFHQNDILKQHLGHVFEIENLAILKEHRGKENLEKILFTVAEYARNHRIQKYIASLDFLLYRTFKVIYPFSMDALSKKIIYKHNSLVPVIINMDQTFLNLERYKWLYDFYESRNLNKCEYCNSSYNYSKMIAWSQETLNGKFHNFRKVSCSKCFELLLHNRNLNIKS
jgi:hypothetical protein